MGNVCGGPPGEIYVAKQDVTIWNYSDPNTSNSIACQKSDEFFLLEGSKDQCWWQVQAKKDRKKVGYASHVYFYHKDTAEDYMKQPWYFGEIPRAEAEESLGQQNNPQGSYLVRWSPKGLFVLDLRIYNDDKRDYFYRHFDVKRDKGKNKYYFSKNNQFNTLIELIKHSTTNEQEGLPTKLTNVSLIPNPHADPGFIRNKKLAVDADAWMVPRSELSFDKEKDKLGEGNFGVVYKAVWRGNLTVAVKQLKISGGGEGAEKALKEFFSEKDLMTKLNHPYLVQLFAICMEEGQDNLLIQEFCSKGDLKEYLKKLDQPKKGSKHTKKHRPKADKDEATFDVLLNWCVQIASGMQHLESLSIIHRDLAARNVLLDSFLRAKVADFGLAHDNESSVEKGEQIPIKWSPPEALFKNQFSHKSDVWSYGILMWEIFSLGDNPYPGVKNTEYKKKVKDGLRCDIPDYDGTSKENLDVVYKIMCACWNPKPMKRPTFEALRDDLENFIATGEFEIDYDELTNYNIIDADGEPLYQE